MLIEFKVGNFLSFRDIQTLRLAQLQNTTSGSTQFGEIADLMLIYGPNGAGKSNLIKAISFAKDIILHEKSESHYESHYGMEDHPSYFEFVIKIKEHVYSYGFELLIKQKLLKSEWLYLLGENNDIPLFENEYVDKEHHPLFLKKYAAAENQTTIAEASREILDWFRYSLYTEMSRMESGIYPVVSDFIEFVGEHLSNLDTGIKSLTSHEFRNKEIPKNLISRIDGCEVVENKGTYVTIIKGGPSKRYWIILTKNDGVNREDYEIRFIHENGYEPFLEEESLGTLRIFQIMTLMSMQKFNSFLKKDGVAIIDEIECSVHTLVVRQLIKLYNQLDNAKAQLIATTHEIDLLRQPDVSRDEISFIDKIVDESDDFTTLYTLRSFGEDIKNREQAYVDGRMGAVPVFTNPDINRS